MLTAIQWTLGIAGLLLLVFGLFWDRPGWRGRAALRCRKCWFDLTGTPGVRDLATFGGVLADSGGSERAVVCGECGKKHKSVRSMRRVRRRWLFAAVGVSLIIGGYVWSAWHRTKYVGWVGLVPTPVALLTIPFMSADAGSPSDNEESQGSDRPRLAIRIRWQIGGRMGNPDACTLLDRWVFRSLAQAEDIEILTDRTSKRGAIYQAVYYGLHLQNRLGDDERQWAEAVHRIDWRCVGDAMVGGRFLVRPRVRFLIQDQELARRLEFMGSVYDIENRQNWQSDGWLPIKPTGIGYSEWWDGAVMSDWHRSGGMFMFPRQPSKEIGRIRGYLYNGSTDSDTWWPAARVHKDLLLNKVSVTRGAQLTGVYGPIDIITEIDGFEVVKDYEQAKSWIEKNLVASLRWERVVLENTYDGYVVHERAPVSVQIYSRAAIHVSQERRDVPIDDIEAFTFGGQVRLVLEINHHNGRRQNWSLGESVIAEGHDAWWAVRDAVDDDGHRVIEHAGKIVPLTLTDEVQFKDSFVEDENEFMGDFVDAYIVVDFGSGIRALGDVDGERYLTAPVKIPLFEHERDMLGRMLVSQEQDE